MDLDRLHVVGLRPFLDHALLPPRQSGVNIAVCSRDLLQVKLVDVDACKRLIPNEFTDVAIEVAVAAQTFLQPIQSPLPLLNLRIGTEAVLKEQKSATGLEDAVCFAQCSPDILNAAQRERADHTIENLVAEW